MPINLSKIDPDALYLVVEAARLLGCKEATVRTYVKDGTLAGVKAKNGNWRIKGSELINFANGSGNPEPGKNKH